MGMLEVPNDTRLQIRRAPSVLDRVVKWRKAKPSKEQQAVKKEFRKVFRGGMKMLREIYEGDDGW